MTESKAPPGVLCALITPFDGDGSPDLAALGDVIDFQAERGVHGLFVLGTTGEGMLLESPQRRRVAEFALDRAGRRMPAIVHCGAPDTGTAAELARHAESIGAVAAATLAPYYFAYGESDLIRHFTSVAEAAPTIGHYVYENPERVGYAAGVRVITRLVNEVPNIHGVKDTGDSIGKITMYLAQTGIRPDVYVGNNVTILPALLVGARGSVSALANAVPELVSGIFERFAAGRLEEAGDLQVSLARLNACLDGMPFVGGVKHLAARRGLPAGATRQPQRSVTPEEAATIDARVDATPDLRTWLEPVADRPRARA